MKTNIHLLLVFALLLGLATSEAISLVSFLSNNGKPDVPRPQNCDVWINNICEACASDYQLNDLGECELKPKTNLKAEPVIDIIDDQFGPVVDPDQDPCEGQTHCIGSTFANDDEIDKFVTKYTSQNTITPTPKILPQIAIRTDGAATGGVQNLAFDAAPAAFQSFSSEAAFKSAPVPAPTPQPAADRDFSGTNNQEENVDEADILKTDGTYIYTISNRVLSIIRAYPSAYINVLSKISLTDFYPSAIFIQGNYLAVFGTQYSTPIYKYAYYQPRTQQTVIKIYDVRNRARPNLIKSYEVEGSYFNGRKTEDGFVYLLTTTRFYNRVYASPWYTFNGIQSHFGYRNLFYFPGIYSSPLFVSIFSFNLANPLRNERGLACLITQSAQTIYMSQNSIFISYTDWNRGSDFSVIHKVYVKRTRIVPFAQAKIRGTINNQFSMDQYRSALRVATTSSSNGNVNQVYCLDYYMNQLGFLGKIAPGERIFSARFVDRRLYLVTFRQVDPFFVISFKNHRAPKILGELKITGFSRYLHPYDEDTIIGLGRQADLNGRQQGLKISLFDVSDVSAPKEADSFQLQEKYASSSAEWEHKAFLFSKSKNLLVIPGSLSTAEVKFNGAFVFYVDPVQITLRGVVDHLQGPSDTFYNRNVQRSLYIEELLYTKSKCLLRVNKIYDLQNVKDIKVPCEDVKIVYPEPVPLPIVIDPVPIPRPIPIPRIADIQIP